MRMRAISSPYLYCKCTAHRNMMIHPITHIVIFSCEIQTAVWRMKCYKWISALRLAHPLYCTCIVTWVYNEYNTQRHVNDYYTYYSQKALFERGHYILYIDTRYMYTVTKTNYTGYSCEYTPGILYSMYISCNCTEERYKYKQHILTKNYSGHKTYTFDCMHEESSPLCNAIRGTCCTFNTMRKMNTPG